MNYRIALCAIILSFASQAQADAPRPSKVRICAHMAKEAGEVQQARKMMADLGILYTANSYFKAREELYKKKLDQAPEDDKVEMEKFLNTARAMDIFIAGEVFKYPSVMPPTFAADQVQAACLRLSDQELVDLLKRK